jgi:hypothetical protein
MNEGRSRRLLDRIVWAKSLMMPLQEREGATITLSRVTVPPLEWKSSSDDHPIPSDTQTENAIGSVGKVLFPNSQRLNRSTPFLKTEFQLFLRK